MHYTIAGDIAQYARLDFEPGEAVWASKGSLMSYTQGVQWQLRLPGGVGGAIRRSLAGEGMAFTHLSTDQAGQHATLVANSPGHITTWDLADGPVLTTRGAFLAAWGDEVDITVTIARRAGAALFGGAGLFLQRISGRGMVLIHGSGDFYERTLADGEEMLVSTGNLAAFADNVDYDIQGVGGCRRILFSGEGFFMTRLRGPGRVLLQSLKRTSGGSSGGDS
ncbi:MAG: AIM24 family protein [Caldilineaceae bacterium]|nr:AIM24 family protein [Caldilineaceae bacterium]